MKIRLVGNDGQLVQEMWMRGHQSPQMLMYPNMEVPLDHPAHKEPVRRFLAFIIFDQTVYYKEGGKAQ